MNFSIHPRNHSYQEKNNRQKSNTCSPRGAGNQKYLRKASERLDRRRRAHEITLKSLPSTVPPSAYREPGSMRLNGKS